jgi:hypothetical protein
MLEASRVDGILTKNARFLSWLKWRDRLDRVVLLLGVLGAGLSVFPSIKLDIQKAHFEAGFQYTPPPMLPKRC